MQLVDCGVKFVVQYLDYEATRGKKWQYGVDELG